MELRKTQRAPGRELKIWMLFEGRTNRDEKKGKKHWKLRLTEKKPRDGAGCSGLTNKAMLEKRDRETNKGGQLYSLYFGEGLKGKARSREKPSADQSLQSR